MNMFARFDENPAMTLWVIKETKRYGRTDGHTDGRTHGQRENSIPPTNKVCGGYKYQIWGVFKIKSQFQMYGSLSQNGKKLSPRLYMRDWKGVPQSLIFYPLIKEWFYFLFFLDIACAFWILESSGWEKNLQKLGKYRPTFGLGSSLYLAAKQNNCHCTTWSRHFHRNQFSIYGVTGVNTFQKFLPKQLRHLVSFEGPWLLHLRVLRMLHTKLWFSLN